jgi:predicted DCC family thiol-disulfide oxidoreductase YuxK
MHDQMPSGHKTPLPAMTVFFDGACPLCAREISMYRKCRGADLMQWVDVATAPAELLPATLIRDQVLARFHLQDRHGRIVSGAEAFAMLWSALPAFRILGWVFRQPVMTAILERLYVSFLKHRPRISRMISGRKPICAGGAQCGSP